MRNFLYTTSVLTIGMLLTVTGSSLANAPSCTFLLEDNHYLCEVKSESGAKAEECLRLSSTGIVSSKFDVFVVGIGEVLGCSCKAQGSFDTAQFNTSKEFFCTNDSSIALEGKVTRKGKIKGGQIVYGNGQSFVYRCKVVPSC